MFNLKKILFSIYKSYYVDNVSLPYIISKKKHSNLQRVVPDRLSRLKQFNFQTK